MMNFKINKNVDKQNGSALLITIIALLMLTVVALAATNSNQIQSIMVRNNQFRLEAFNINYAEIEGQIDAINGLTLSEGSPSYILAMIDNNVGTTVRNTSSDVGFSLPTFSRSSGGSSYLQGFFVSQTFRGSCPVFGTKLGAGQQTVVCNEIEIDTTAGLQNTNIRSSQNQVYEYRTLSGT